MSNSNYTGIEQEVQIIETWKNEYAYPLLSDVSYATFVDVKTLLVKTYAIMKNDYKFDMSLAQTEFNKKFNDRMLSNGINVVASTIESQKLFIQSLRDLTVYILSKTKLTEKRINELLSNNQFDNVYQIQKYDIEQTNNVICNNTESEVTIK